MIHQLNMSGKDMVDVAIERLQMFEPRGVMECEDCVNLAKCEQKEYRSGIAKCIGFKSRESEVQDE